MPAVVAYDDVSNRATANDGSEWRFFTVRYDYRIDVLVELQKTEEGFTVIRTAAALAADTECASVSLRQL